MRIFIIAFLILSLASCSSVKKVNRTSTNESEKISVDSASQSQKEVKTDTKNLTVTTTEIDTAVHDRIKGIEGSKAIADLAQPWILENDDHTINVSLDSGKLKIKSTGKDRTIPVKMKQTVISQTDISKTEKSSVSKTTSIDQEKETKIKNTDKDVKRSFALPWWIWLIIILAAVAFIWFKLYRQ